MQALRAPPAPARVTTSQDGIGASISSSGRTAGDREAATPSVEDAAAGRRYAGSSSTPPMSGPKGAEAHDRGSAKQDMTPRRGRCFKPSASPRGQSLRPRRAAQMAPMATDQSTHRRQRDQVQQAIGAAPLGHQVAHVLAVRLPPTQPPLQAQSTQPPGHSRTRCEPRLLQTPRPPHHEEHGPSRWAGSSALQGLRQPRWASPGRSSGCSPA